MPTIEVTDEQLERLEAVRIDVSETLAGPYGHVRTTDALEYLLDTYTPPDAAPMADAPVAGSEGGDTGSAAIDEGSELTAIDPIGSSKAAALERSGYETVADLRGATIAELVEVEGIGETLATRILDAVGGDTATDENTSTEEDTSTEETATAESAADDGESAASDPPSDGGDADASRLNAMMNLLDEHDDKWRESSGDEPYEVDLPDGSVESVRTKDDVRGVLFRHYR